MVGVAAFGLKLRQKPSASIRFSPSGKDVCQQIKRAGGRVLSHARDFDTRRTLKNVCPLSALA
jgi:hypothetical protein